MFEVESVCWSGLVIRRDSSFCNKIAGEYKSKLNETLFFSFVEPILGDYGGGDMSLEPTPSDTLISSPLNKLFLDWPP